MWLASLSLASLWLASLSLASLWLPIVAGDMPPPLVDQGSGSLELCRTELRSLHAQIHSLHSHVTSLEAALSVANAFAESSITGEDFDEPGSAEFYVHLACALACVCLAGLAAGLTMGLVSIEPMCMQIILNTSEQDMVGEKDKLKLREDKVAAARILPVIQNHHRLLVTLLLLNSIAFEALPLFLDRLVPAWLAIIFSVSLVLVFGEILPSAVFTGRNQLRIAAKFAPLVMALQLLLAPITWSLAWVLDRLLGEDHKGRYNFAELRAIVDMHGKMRSGVHAAVVFKSIDHKGLGIITTEQPHHFTSETAVIFTSAPSHPAASTKLTVDERLYYVAPCEPVVGRGNSHTFRLYTTEERDEEHAITLEHDELKSGAFLVQERDEIKIMSGVMKLTHMTAADNYLPLSQTYMLESNQLLTNAALHDILQSGHSRIPVCSDGRHNVRGFILTKRMIVTTPDAGQRVSDIQISPMVLVPPTILMLDLLNLFQAERCHLALVTSHPEGVREAWRSNTVIPPDVHMMGIITLEDVIEKLIQEDIFDEEDTQDLAAKFRRGSTLDSTSTLDSIRSMLHTGLPLLLGAASKSFYSSTKTPEYVGAPCPESGASTLQSV